MQYTTIEAEEVAQGSLQPIAGKAGRAIGPSVMIWPVLEDDEEID